MASNYSAGRQLEYELQTHFKLRGWQCIRSAGSHSFVDLIAFPTREAEGLQYHPFAEVPFYLIQCKSSKNVVDHRQLFNEENIKLFEAAEFPNSAIKIVFVKEGTERNIHRYLYVYINGRWQLSEPGDIQWFDYLMEKEGPGYAANRHAKALQRIEKKG